MSVQFPPAFKNQMLSLLGENEYASFEQSYTTKGPVSIRINSAKYIHPVKLEQVPWTTNGYYLPERPSFTSDPLLHGGAYYVQEASSMFIEQALMQLKLASRPIKVLDLCAAPGGKTTHLISLLSQDSLIVANEVIKSRAYILKENIQKWGRPNVVITNSDPERFSSLTDFFDVILIDAPCSGEGLFRRDEEAMKEWSPENVSLCVARQERIVEAVWPALKPGGVLLYSTCTFNSMEDEQRIDWLLETMEGKSLPIALKEEWGVTEVVSSKGGFGYKFFPHKVKGEGFFLTAYKKAESEDGNSSSRKAKSPFVNLPKEIHSEVSNWINDGTLELVQYEEQVLAIPTHYKNELLQLIRALHIVSSGLEVAEIKKKNCIPMPALALSTALNKEYFPSVELPYKEALLFLAKENFDSELPEGDWILATYKGVSLGWLKKINLRFNNYYPIEWRIRMNVSNLTNPPAIV